MDKTIIELMCVSQYLIRRCMLYPCVSLLVMFKLDHLVKVVSVVSLPCKVIFPFVIKNIWGEP